MMEVETKLFMGWERAKARRSFFFLPHNQVGYTAAVMPAAKPAKKPSRLPKKTSNPEFVAVFAALRGILAPFRSGLAIQTDKPGNYHIEFPFHHPSRQAALFCWCADREKLRELSSDASVRLPRTAGGHVSGVEEAHAGQVLLQLYRYRSGLLCRTWPTDRRRAEKI